MDQDLFILFFCEGTALLRGNFARLDDHLVEFESDGLPLKDFLLNRRLSDEPVNIHLLLLAYSVSTVHGLEVNLRVPVRVIQDDMVRSHQVQAETSCTCGEHENGQVRAWLGELTDVLFSLLQLGGAVKPAELVLSHRAVILEDVEEASEVREQQDLLPLLLDFLEKPVQELEFPTIFNQVLTELVCTVWLNTIEHVRMVACLTKLYIRKVR